jgi:hypothetical protein
MELNCPVCGSSDISETEKTETIKMPYSHPVEIKKHLNKCNNCGEIGSFFDQKLSEDNKTIIETAKKESINGMIHFLSSASINMAYFERALQLPQRTLIRWKNDGCSAPSLALLRIVRTYPWILKVADENFDDIYSKKELAKQFVGLFLEAKNPLTSFSIEKNQNEIVAKIGVQANSSANGSNLFFSVNSQQPPISTSISSHSTGVK